MLSSLAFIINLRRYTVAPLWDEAQHGAPMAPMAVAMPYHPPPPPREGYPMAGGRPPMATAMHQGMVGPYIRSLFQLMVQTVLSLDRDAMCDEEHYPAELFLVCVYFAHRITISTHM